MTKKELELLEKLDEPRYRIALRMQTYLNHVRGGITRYQRYNEPLVDAALRCEEVIIANRLNRLDE